MLKIKRTGYRKGLRPARAALLIFALLLLAVGGFLLGYFLL